MPILITKVTAEVLDYITDKIYFVGNVSGDIQFEDYININGFIAYLQNFTMVNYVEKLIRPLKFGLINKYNQTEVTLEISY